MDCCNYMQYRNHRQPYGYEPAYYDHFNDYNHSTDFYGQHNVYHDYYNTQYYPNQWTQVPSFTDYVYNPKEARMRKAMREANRDRSFGASPMLPRPGTRLPPPHTEWAQPPDEPLVMNHMENMRGMEAQMCGYPLSTHENNQYMSPMNDYNKIDPPSMMPNYMQPSPLAQLQQQTEMWHTYQDNMRSRSMVTPYHHQMLPEMQSSPVYHTQEPVQDAPTNLIMEKPRRSPGCATKQTLSRNASPRSIPEENPANQTQTSHFIETNMSAEGMMNDSKSQEGQYLPTVAETLMSYETTPKTENAPPKKDSSSIPYSTLPSSHEYNQAEYIERYFSEQSDYYLVMIQTSDGFTLPYASLSPNGQKSAKAFLELTGLKNEPYLIPTDVGYIPILENDFILEEPVGNI